ncbi:glycoside hydrolase family 32 protein [Agarivorans sp. Z349TD_8]|uniref:glycoside hydrolase family 32 protein n=1 Tax=Agarivorans sp. Z349TD_8 TaxID=3421434 RepID=UPI003D7EA9D6
MDMLEPLIVACGGKDNLQRIQKVHNLLIAELVDPELRMVSSLPLTFNAPQEQIVWQPAPPLSTQQWQILGSIVDTNLRKQLQEKAAPVSSPYRPTWHISAEQGFLGDPNAFVYFQGAYHLFYVLSPDCEDKRIAWAHVTSTDLVNWVEHPIALMPSDWFDSHGVYSGHCIVHDEQLMLFYTGNVRIGEQRQRMTYQCLATSTDGFNFRKQGPVIEDLPPQVTAHCRDPKIVRNGDHWLMFVGAQLTSGLGRLASYRSADLHHWEFAGIFGDELGDFGYMWECPDLIEVDGQLIAIICPQGIVSNSPHYQIDHHNGYLKASLDPQDELHLDGFSRLDYGFDFYAMQTGKSPDGRALLVAWMGLPDENQHPTKAQGWLHQLTCIRELSFDDGKLYQRPARELQALRSAYQDFELSVAAEQQITLPKGRSYELQMNLSWLTEGAVDLHFMSDEQSYCRFSLDGLRQKIVLDRSGALPTDGEKIRELDMVNQQDVKLQILVDQSSIEIFINDGEFVMTAVVFTEPGNSRLKLSATQPMPWQPIHYWTLAKPGMGR